MKHLARRLAAVAGCVSAVLAGGTSAADWTFDPSLEGGVIAAKNYTLARGNIPEVDVFGPFIDVALPFRGRTPQTEVLFQPRVRAANFPGDSDQNSNSGYLDLKLDHSGELSRAGFLARYTNEFIVDSELRGATTGGRDPGQDLGQGGGPDSGRVTVDNRRRWIQFDPYAQFSLTERTRLRFDANFSDISYDTEVAGSQQSYQAWGASAGVAHDLSESSAISVTVNHYRYDPDLAGFQSDTNGARAQWDYRVAERVRAYVRAGFDRTQPARAIVGAESKTTPLYGAGAVWTFQRSQLFLDVLREVDANGSGFVVKRDEIHLWGTRQFTQKLSGFAAIYAIRDGAVQATTLYTPRRYFSGSVGMDWRFTRTVAFSAQVTEGYQKFRGETDSANGTTGVLSIVWRPNRVD